MTDNEKENKLRFYIILLFVLTLIAFFLAGLALGKVRRLEEEIERITTSEYHKTVQPLTTSAKEMR